MPERRKGGIFITGAAAQAVLAAVSARKPRRRYAAGRGVRAFGVLAHLPVSVGERLVASAFGLRGSVAGGQA